MNKRSFIFWGMTMGLSLVLGRGEWACADQPPMGRFQKMAEWPQKGAPKAEWERAFGDPDPLVCQWAVFAADRLNTPEAETVLYSASRHQDPAMRWWAFRSLLRRVALPGRSAIIERAFQDSDSSIRLEAVLAITPSASDKFEALMQRALIDPEPVIRQRVLSTLHQQGIKQLPALIKALEDADESIRSCAVWMVGRLKHPDVLGALTLRASTGLSEARRAALQALAGFAPESLPVLEKILLDEKDEPMASYALEVIRGITHPEVVPVLKRALRHANPSIQAGADAALLMRGINTFDPDERLKKREP